MRVAWQLGAGEGGGLGRPGFREGAHGTRYYKYIIYTCIIYIYIYICIYLSMYVFFFFMVLFVTNCREVISKKPIPAIGVC